MSGSLQFMDMESIINNEERRSGNDRRSFSYDIYVPEKRLEKKNRRSGKDRRKKLR